MPKQSATATWKGSIKDGRGEMRLDSGKAEFDFGSRFEDKEGSNPEELLGASHAGCFSMAFSKALGDEGFEPKSIETKATVTLDKLSSGFAITQVDLDTEAEVPDIEDEKFQELAESAKKNCPVSRLFAGALIQVRAKLKSS